MKLLKMNLENFQGIKKLELDLQGRNANIYGDNGTGKTTVFNAFTWLIFGKASTGANDYSPKTKAKEGDEHNLDHSVECEMEIDGEIVNLRRVFHEVWKKTRGHAEANLSGHTTDYYINGVPKKEKEYVKFWEEIFETDEIPKLLSMPFYFSETLHWEKRRNTLLEICGTVSDLAIMESDTELKELAKLIGKNTVDEFKKIIRASLTEINRTIQSIPARIDEANKAIPEFTGDSIEVIDKALEELQVKISDAQKEKASILANNDTAKACLSIIADLNLKLSEERGKYAEKEQAESANAYKVLQDAREELSSAEKFLSELNVDKYTKKVAEIEKMRTEILEQHRKKFDEHSAVSAEVFDEANAICTTCGQELPTGKADEIREAFNENKSNRLLQLTEEMNELVEKGKKEASADMLEQAKQELGLISENAKATQIKVDILKEKLEDAEKIYKQAKLPQFETTEIYLSILEEINKAKSQEKNEEPDTSVIDSKLLELKKQENDLNVSKANFETEKQQRLRITELEKQESELGKQYEVEQQSLYLCEKFTRVKSAILNEKINERFKTVSFQLFKKNITNDGIDDICDVLIPTADGKRIPFSLANNAARINAGIEVIDVLSKYYGVELPVFVDNAESVTKIVGIDGQMIRLVVSESDKKLRMEIL